jgi:hypothetical protein
MKRKRIATTALYRIDVRGNWPDNTGELDL